MQTLRISKDKRRIETADGTPFFLLGDTAWELFHALTREETEYYLRTRQSQGFNMIQCVTLAELEGLTKPNAYGRVPLLQNESGAFDPTMPDLAGEYSYFDHMEWVISLAESLHLYMGILPTWGDKFHKIWGAGPEIFTPENAFLYGQWLGKRFSHHNNILWILGGDRPLGDDNHKKIVDVMAHGLKEGDGGKFLLTFHPCGAHSSSAFVHGRDWLDFHMLQSGHGSPSPWCFDMMATDYTRPDFVPVMDGEPCYEDHPINFQVANGYFDAVDVRRAALWNLFGGACGNTYGHHAVWQFRREPDAYCPNHWKTALHRPGALWLRKYRDFVAAHPMVDCWPVYNIMEENRHDAGYVAAMVGSDRAYLYLPTGISGKLNRSALPFTVEKIRFWEPVSGTYHDTGVTLDKNDRFVLPNRAAGRGMDVVLLVSGTPKGATEA